MRALTYSASVRTGSRSCTSSPLCIPDKPARSTSLLASDRTPATIRSNWAQRRGGVVPPELIGRIAPTRTEGINLRGVFWFPVERYADKLLPSAQSTVAACRLHNM